MQKEKKIPFIFRAAASSPMVRPKGRHMGRRQKILKRILEEILKKIPEKVIVEEIVEKIKEETVKKEAKKEVNILKKPITNRCEKTVVKKSQNPGKPGDPSAQ